MRITSPNIFTGVVHFRYLALICNETKSPIGQLLGSYTKPQRSAAVPTLQHRGATADRHEDKARMVMEISIPTPTPYDGDDGVPGPPGTAYQSVTELVMQCAFRGTSCKRSPEPDGIGRLAIRCVYDWDLDRIVALIRTYI